MPLRKKQRVSTESTSLVDSTGRQRSFLWVIKDFRQWPPSNEFNLNSSIFTLDENRFQVSLKHVDSFLEPSLHLMTKPNQHLSAHIKFSIVGALFRCYNRLENSCVFKNRNQICHFPKFVPQHEVLGEDKKLCSNGDLLLLCEMTFLEVDTYHLEDFVSPDLAANMRYLLENKVCSDFAIQVEDEHFLCHKALLSCRSEFFRSMFRTNMKEKLENKLTISDIDPFLVQKLLQYIYTGHVDILPSEAFLLFSAAHRYQLERLQSLCEEKINLILWEGNAAYISKFASVFNLPQLKLRSERILQDLKNQITGWDYYNASSWNVNKSNNMAGVTRRPTNEQMHPVTTADSNRIFMQELHAENEVSSIRQVTTSGEKPSNKENVSVISDLHTAGPSTANKLQAEHHLEEFAAYGPPRPEDVPPEVNVWCCTENHLLSELKWRITGMDKICKAQTLDIRSPQFYLKDKDTNMTSVWQVGVHIVHRRSSPGSGKYFSLRLTRIVTNSAETTVEYKLNLLTTDNIEKHTVVGMQKFKEMNSIIVSRYYLRIDDILQHKSYLHDGTDLILCCQLMKRKSILFDAAVPFVVPKCDLSTDILALLTSKSYCDVVISVEDISFECHKAILTVASPYLATIFEGQHKYHRLFEIPDMKAKVFELLQWYIYSGVVKKCDEFKMMPEANKLGLTGMITVLEQRLISSICAENAAKLLISADTNACSKLRAECVRFISLHSKEVMSTAGWLDVAKNDTLYTECMKTRYTDERFTDIEMMLLGIDKDCLQ